ncbi:Asp23/Gls24 family envelope stress response protein [Actinokineospora xionganensis]|uniref:Asp23/Gls24 family envelope stress response protein n=1 Tax=Actinokineospora xionganensis TaxID=2684470 RepID=A0ABR7KZC3_9PSEU|nr:Asp23/Gls24 family envelope stress response protein [Actinokineospora xionganensis]MBC6445790.1 Asp23/Gls24 family envelope stress response protein [Actinokineospora xionganensis]
MSDVINSIFGRPKYDAPRTGDHAGASTSGRSAIDPGYVAVTDETVDTTAIEGELTDSPVETDSAQTDVESADTEAAEGDEAVADTDADEDGQGVATDGDDDGDDDGDGDDDDRAADDDGDADLAEYDLADDDVAERDEVEPIAVESDDAPVAAATVAEEDHSDVVEPVTAEARPAAGARGSTTVGDGVVTKIVNLVARKAEGVHDLGDEGISVEVDGDVATIKVTLVVEFGHAVNPVAEQVRVNVVEAVEQFLGLDVAVVDVHVTDIHIPDAG